MNNFQYLSKKTEFFLKSGAIITWFKKREINGKSKII